MKTLITLLGNSPGTVTGVYYALHERDPQDLPDQVVIVATQNRESESCIKMIRDKFRHPADHEPDSPRLIEELIPIEDLSNQEDTECFQGKIAQILRQQREVSDNEVWLSIAGGRKSMAALAAIAAQLIGVDHIVHFYVDRELEQWGDINQLLQYPEWRDVCLHPAPEKYKLVEVPVYLLGQESAQLDHWLKTGFETFFLEVVRANPSILQTVTKDKKLIYAYWEAARAREMLPSRHYETLTIQILSSPDTSDVFPVITSGEGFPDGKGQLTPSFKPEELQTFIDFAGHFALAPEDSKKMQALGSKLFNSLFTGSLRTSYYRLQTKLEDPAYTLRIRFWIDQKARLGDVPLYRVPWELLFDEEYRTEALGPEPFLALRPNISLSRYISLGQPSGLHPEALPLKIQVAAASPRGSDKWRGLPEKYELNALWEGLKAAALGAEVNGLSSPPRTFDALQHEVEAFGPSMVYFTGHGNQGILVFEDEEGKADERSAEVVGSTLAGLGVKLVVLNACYGAQAAKPDLFSVAERLLAAGIPAVVAMQSAIVTGRVNYAPAVIFVKQFFYYLMAGLPVDVAVARTRLAMHNRLPRSLQWVLPVCFLRSENGQLFIWDQD